MYVYPLLPFCYSLRWLNLDRPTASSGLDEAASNLALAMAAERRKGSRATGLTNRWARRDLTTLIFESTTMLYRRATVL